MVDPDFFPRTAAISLRDLAELAGAPLPDGPDPNA
jgi:hypothetical protein